MNAAVARLQQSDLDALWSRSEPEDLELDAETGRVAVREQSAPRARGAVNAIRTAAPAVAGAATLIASEARRWD